MVAPRSSDFLFQPTPPVGAETPGAGISNVALFVFQPTPPVGAETRGSSCAPNSPQGISTHSARGGGDFSPWPNTFTCSNFNPLRPWGRRPEGNKTSKETDIFQPTPPVGAETWMPSILRSKNFNFNPLRPWGRRHQTCTGSPWHICQYWISAPRPLPRQAGKERARTRKRGGFPGARVPPGP